MIMMSSHVVIIRNYIAAELRIRYAYMECVDLVLVDSAGDANVSLRVPLRNFTPSDGSDINNVLIASLLEYSTDVSTVTSPVPMWVEYVNKCSGKSIKKGGTAQRPKLMIMISPLTRPSFYNAMISGHAGVGGHRLVYADNVDKWRSGVYVLDDSKHKYVCI